MSHVVLKKVTFCHACACVHVCVCETFDIFSERAASMSWPGACQCSQALRSARRTCLSKMSQEFTPKTVPNPLVLLDFYSHGRQLAACFNESDTSPFLH